MRNKFVYSCSIKIHALGFDQLLENIFCLLLFVEASSLQKVVEMLEEVVVGWPEVRWIWQMRQNFVAQFVQLLKRWLYNVRSDVVIEKNRALSVDQCWLHALQFLVRLIYLLSILLGCNGFTRIQKAVVGQMSSRPPVTMTFFWCKFGFGKCFGASSSSNHKLVVTGYHTQCTFHCMSESDREMVCCCCIEYEKMTLQNDDFFDFQTAHEASTYRAFSPFQLASNVKCL